MARSVESGRFDEFKERLKDFKNHFIGNLTGTRVDDNLVDLDVDGRKINFNSVKVWIYYACMIFIAVFIAMTAQDVQTYVVLKAAGYNFTDPSVGFASPPNGVYVVFVGIVCFIGVYFVSIVMFFAAVMLLYALLLRNQEFGKEYMGTGVALGALVFVILSFVSLIFAWHPHMPWVRYW